VQRFALIEGKSVGQFLAPSDVRHAIAKVVAAGNPGVIVTERGTTFGYNNLVVDMRAFPLMRRFGEELLQTLHGHLDEATAPPAAGLHAGGAR
jgi:2-dehydro-3-deoxyphosphooctonate aldolase (KDO 8-P synthase)